MGEMNLMITMPTGGQVATPAVKSLIGLTQYLQRTGIAFTYQTYEFSDIVFSRNQLAACFLSDARFSHVLMLDSDLAYPVKTLQRMIAFEAPFTAATYPQKFIPWQRLRRLIEEDAKRPANQRRATRDLVAASWTFTLQRGGFNGRPWSPRRRNGFMTVPSTGTGMMLVAREVFEQMIENGSAPRLARHEGLIDRRAARYHDFFSHRRNRDGSFLYAEDQSFCLRWVEDCGGDIWLDTEADLTHWGPHGFAGRYANRAPFDFPDHADATPGQRAAETT
ncbi:MAG: hypothetical protein AAFR17_09510 [Pseudomonadota bacterium]